MSNVKQEYAWVNSSRVYFEAVGSGEPVILIHGLSGSGRWWTRNTTALARNFRVYTIDLIGFGSSRRQPFLLHEAAEILTGWMDKVHLKQAHLVGHSMGGYIAADLAANFPDRVQRLVLVDAAALPIKRSYIRHGWNLLHALRYMPLSFLPVLIVDAWRAGPFAILKAAREILSAHLTEKLAQIEAPTLIVWGAQDTLIPIDVAKALQQHIPNAEFFVVQGAGHNPMWDRPERFNQVVTAFLSRANNAGAGAEYLTGDDRKKGSQDVTTPGEIE